VGSLLMEWIEVGGGGPNVHLLRESGKRPNVKTGEPRASVFVVGFKRCECLVAAARKGTAERSRSLTSSEEGKLTGKKKGR